jgi:hypothetical protein
MRIKVLYFEGCPNHRPTVARVKQLAVDLGLQVDVEEMQVTTPEEAQRLRFLGSPTVLVEGIDIDPNARHRATYGLSCRVYPGVSGLPPDDFIIAALQSPPESP